MQHNEAQRRYRARKKEEKAGEKKITLQHNEEQRRYRARIKEEKGEKEISKSNTQRQREFIQKNKERLAATKREKRKRDKTKKSEETLKSALEEENG